MSSLNLMDVKSVTVLRNCSVKTRDGGEFTTTDIIVDTEKGEFSIILFGPKEGIPLSTESHIDEPSE